MANFLENESASRATFDPETRKKRRKKRTRQREREPHAHADKHIYVCKRGASHPQKQREERTKRDTQRGRATPPLYKMPWHGSWVCMCVCMCVCVGGRGEESDKMETCVRKSASSALVAMLVVGVLLRCEAKKKTLGQ